MEAVLDRFTEANIFLLDFVAEGDGALDALLRLCRPGILEEPFKDGQGLVVSEGDNEVRRNIVRVDVEHEVREDPEVEGFLERARSGSVNPRADGCWWRRRQISRCLLGWR